MGGDNAFFPISYYYKHILKLLLYFSGNEQHLKDLQEKRRLKKHMKIDNQKRRENPGVPSTGGANDITD